MSTTYYSVCEIIKILDENLLDELLVDSKYIGRITPVHAENKNNLGYNSGDTNIREFLMQQESTCRTFVVTVFILHRSWNEILTNFEEFQIKTGNSLSLDSQQK